VIVRVIWRIPRVVATTNTERARNARRDTYLGQRTRDGVTVGLANGSMLGSGEAGEEGNDGGLCEHVDCCVGYYLINA
jgi:hypothetical protein